MSDHASPWVRGLSSEVKWPRREAGQSSPSTDEADVCNYTSSPSWSIFHETIKTCPRVLLLSVPMLPLVCTDRHVLLEKRTVAFLQRYCPWARREDV